MAEAAAHREWWKYAIVTVPAIVLAGSASGWLSNSGYGNSWFDGLIKPFFMPPGWAFGVVWPILYLACLALPLALIFAEPPSTSVAIALILFFVQLALNFAWSPIFFAAHRIQLALGVIVAMAGFAALAAGQFRQIRPLAGAADGPVPALALLRLRAQLGHRQSQSGRGV